MHLGNVCDQPRETSDGYHVGVFYVACELTFFFLYLMYHEDQVLGIISCEIVLLNPYLLKISLPYINILSKETLKYFHCVKTIYLNKFNS